MRVKRRDLHKFIIVMTVIVICIFFVNTAFFLWIKAQDFISLATDDMSSNEEFTRHIGRVVTVDIRYLGKKEFSWSGGTITVGTDIIAEGDAGRCVVYVRFVEDGGSWHVTSTRMKTCTAYVRSPSPRARVKRCERPGTVRNGQEREKKGMGDSQH